MNNAWLSRHFKFSWFGLSVYVLLLIVLCSLGFWQVGRSEQKKQILQQQQAAIAAPGLNLNQQPVSDVDAVKYHKVTVTGHYDQAHQFLIDNQIVDGKTGYFVLTPFVIDQSDHVVLVNRGWVELGVDRRLLPDVSVSSASRQINGRINRFPSVGIKLAGAEIPAEGWPAVVQVVDSLVLAEKLGYALYDFQIELDADAEDGYKRQWKINMPIPPEKHLAYAVQWFGLALTLTGLFIWMSIRKRSEHTA